MKTKHIFLLVIGLLLTLVCKAQHLETYINEALVNNPKIEQFELQYKKASEKINEVNTLPNTEFGFGYFISEPETRTGAQKFKLSAKQMLPWFGTIAKRQDYISALSEVKYEAFVIAKKQLITSVAQSYYKLYALQAKQQVLTENIKLIDTYETLALTSVEVGKASAVDVLRLQMRKNLLLQQKKVLNQEFLAEKSTLNKLLNREKNRDVNVIDKLVIPAEGDDVSFENLERHPELLKFDKEYNALLNFDLVNKSESNPMFGIGLDYVNVAERPNIDLSNNGKDIVMPMVSLSIPIFNNKYKSVAVQNEIEKQSINAEKQERLNQLITLLENAIAKRNSAKITYKTQLDNIEKAKSAENILLKSYETGTINFNDVLDIQQLQLQFQLNKIEAVKAYYIQRSVINYLTN